MKNDGYLIGIDVGGTFTDIVRLDQSTGEIEASKVPTDYVDPVAPMLMGIELFGGGFDNIASLRHATTLATNAVIECKLPATALLTTRGFRDVLDIGRIQRPEEGIYDFNIDTPQPLVDRAYRFEVTERIGARGEVVMPLDEAALRETLSGMAGQGIEAIAVSCLFAFVNDEHESRIAEIVKEELPGVYVSLSSEVSPEIREFERTSTVVLDAALKPVLAPYLATLESRIHDAGIPSVRIMMASGGLTDCGLAATRPATMVNSGPAAGVLASANLGRAIGIESFITIDMGGTSLDIGVVEDGHPVQKFEGDIAGYPLRVPMIDVAAVAAGGGSLAKVDQLGFIQVDRESAGSDPGPACYGRGGKYPTITDADLLLNRLSESFAGRGGLTLKRNPAVDAFENTICAELQISANEAAAGILEIIQARMVKAISAHTLEQGLDIRNLPLVVYGGAGPAHGVELAEAMGMNRVIVPYFAGNFSAIGLMLSPLRWDASVMVMKPATELTAAAMEDHIRQLDTRARQVMSAADPAQKNLSTFWRAHMRYAGQSYDLAIDLGEVWAGALSDDVIARLVQEFHSQHARRFAYWSEGETVEIVQFRVSVQGRETPYPKPAASTSGGREQTASDRQVYFTGGREFRHTAVLDRVGLPRGTKIRGPAVVEGEGSSTLIPPGWSAEVDSYLNLDIRRMSAGSS